MDNWTWKDRALAFMAMACLLSFTGGVLLGKNFGIKEVRNEAVKAGAGEFFASKYGDEIQFRFIKESKP